jgi:hypothetical protein
MSNIEAGKGNPALATLGKLPERWEYQAMSF